MLSYDRKTKGITLTKHLGYVRGYFIIWSQMVSKEGRIWGIGSFFHKEQQRRGDWGKTLQKRIKAIHEKGKDWKNV